MPDKINIIESIQLDFGLIELRSDEILTFIPKESISTFNLDQVKELLAALKKITAGIPKPYYTDNSNLNSSLESEIKTFISNHFHEFATMCAMKENSAITRFIPHTFVHLNKPKIPIKMFKTEKEAIHWLKSLN